MELTPALIKQITGHVETVLHDVRVMDCAAQKEDSVFTVLAEGETGLMHIDVSLIPAPIDCPFKGGATGYDVQLIKAA